MTTLSPRLEDYRIAQQERYAIEREYKLARDKVNSPTRITIRQTQLLMNKYPIDKAMNIAKRYNTMKGVK